MREIYSAAFLLLPFLISQLRRSKLSLKVLKRGRPVNNGTLSSAVEANLSAAATRLNIHFVSSERLVNKVFDEADTNHDGGVDFSEVYELVLKIYITINRQASIPPPSKNRVLQLFLNADTSHTNKLSRTEFKGLANILARWAIVRVMAHKLVTLVGVPLLTAYVMRALKGTAWLPKVAQALVPDRYEEKVLPIITSPAFGQTVLVIILVSTLGNVVLDSVDWIMNLSLEDEEKDPRLHDFKKT